MKKNSKPKREVNKTGTDNELSSLNSSLGSFGLEPPKRYKESAENQREVSNRKSPRRRTQPELKTTDERRAEENRKRKNAKVRRKIIFYILLVVAIVAVIVVLSLTVFFKINTITLKGNSTYTKEEILAVLPIGKGDNLFISDTEKASAKLEESLPYIYNAEVTRKLPSTIIVNITETPIVYSVKNSDKTYTLLDGRFKVLETSAKKNKNAVAILKAELKTAVIGQRADFTETKKMDNLLKLANAIERLKLDKITAINSADINNNTVTYDSRITIKLGSLDKLDNKIYSALSAIDKLNESNPQIEGVLTVSDGKQAYFSEN